VSYLLSYNLYKAYTSDWWREQHVARYRKSGTTHNNNIGKTCCGVSNNGRLTGDQKLVETSLIYRMEPKQNRIMPKNGEQPESVVSVGEKREEVWWEGFVKRGRFWAGSETVKKCTTDRMPTTNPQQSWPTEFEPKAWEASSPGFTLGPRPSGAVLCFSE